MIRNGWGKMWFVLVFLFVSSLLMGGQISACDGKENQDRVQLQILTVNDFHGALVENGKNPGAAKLVRFLNETKKQVPDGTLIVSTGDMFQGSPDSNLLYGKSVVDMMNYAGFDIMTLGNHEFDWGIDVLKQRIAQSIFPYVCANVIDKRTGETVDFVKPYKILVRNGIKIGVIGIATPETAFKTNPKMISGYAFADPVQIVNMLVPVVKQQGADIIIVLAHLSSYDGEKGNASGDAVSLARQTKGIAAVVSGHSHQFTSNVIEGVPVVQAGYNGRGVGKIELIYNKRSRQVDEITSAVVTLPYPGLETDNGMQALLEQVQQEIAPVKGVAIGWTKYALSHDRNDKGETLLGQWATDAMRQAVQADVAFQNMGGLRAGIDAGMITMGNLYEIMPFDNTLYTVGMTGEQIRKILEYGLLNDQAGILQYSGLKVRYDADNQRIITVTLTSGAPLHPKKTYKVVANDFMVAGGDGFMQFQAGRHLTDTGTPVREVLVNAIIKQKIIDFSGDNRLERVNMAKQQRKNAA